LIGEPDV